MNALLFFQIFKELVLETTFEQTDKCERHDHSSHSLERR